jgi:phosphohistidine phosphatase
MGTRLKKHGVLPDLIYTSPARRARKTAKHIALSVGYPFQNIEQKAGIYTSDLNRLLTLVQETDSHIDNLFLVGHNYVLTDFVEYLTDELLGNVPTCGIVAISFDVEQWSEVSGGAGKLLFFDYPKKHPDRDTL